MKPVASGSTSTSITQGTRQLFGGGYDVDLDYSMAHTVTMKHPFFTIGT